jgi:putative ABC transport system ATP-binding protein
MPGDETHVEVTALEKVYGSGETRVCALDKVDICVGQGEFVALMGPSGSGKTTLLNIVAGIDDATSGSVRVGGADLAAMSDGQRTAWRTRNIGYIFQFYNLMPVLSAYENVELPLLLLPMSRAERHDHVLAALEAAGISDRMAHKPNQLSGGQQQRVAIARAIVTDARLLVADEPTGNLDAESEEQIMDLMSRLNREFEKTIMMVTHDAAAAKFAARTVHLEKGHIR